MPDRKSPTIIMPGAPLDEAVRAYEAGGILAYPTETCWGLGVNPYNVSAIERLFSLKGRQGSNPLSILVSDQKMLLSVVDSIPDAARPLIERFWPGPLTIVFNAAKDLPAVLCGGTRTIGVRISSATLCKRLLAKLGRPITSTSANPSGSPAALSSNEVIKYFGVGVDVVIEPEANGSMCAFDKPSTVIDATGDKLRLIREGALLWRDIVE